VRWLREELAQEAKQREVRVYAIAFTEEADFELLQSLAQTILTRLDDTFLLEKNSYYSTCSIGATLGNGGWATLINSAKGPLLINGQPPVPPPAIPEGRLNLPIPGDEPNP
jgi:hypothetical protein